MSLAILAGAGALPGHLVAARPDAIVRGVWGFGPKETAFRLEQFGSLLDDLAAEGVDQICLAGAVSRVALDPGLIDEATRPLINALSAALAHGGDDGALRALARIIEPRFEIVGAHDVAPDLLPPAGILTGALTLEIERMADQGMALLSDLSAFDLGQACVILGHRIQGVEAAPGTDALLASLNAPGGVLCKAPKTDQDRRFDLPAIGPRTVDGAARAGLAAVVIEFGGVMVLDREETVRAAHEQGVTLWVR